MHKRNKSSSSTGSIIIVGISLVMLMIVSAILLWIFLRAHQAKQVVDNQAQTVEESTSMKLETHIVLSSLNKPWDVVFADERMLVAENDGVISEVADGKKLPLFTLKDVDSTGEGGLMGLAVDPQYSQNHYIYACYNTSKDIRVSRWTISDDLTQFVSQNDIVTGITTNTAANPGRHSGCRIAFGPDGNLWIGTGDAAVGSSPQDPQSLGGKILRVDREGKPASGNLGAPFDMRVYSYGHRNIQGIAFAKDAEYIGVSLEHGPNVNDELNLLNPGNFGWNPVPGYNEAVSMTDLVIYPDAKKEVWASGSSTLAPSGATFVYGDQWGEYDGALFVAMLKAQQVRVFNLKSDGSHESNEAIFSKQFGRVRTIRQGSDGALYLTTDNGNNQDVIVRVTPAGL